MTPLIIVIVAALLYVVAALYYTRRPRCDVCGKPLSNRYVVGAHKRVCSKDCSIAAQMEWAREVYNSSITKEKENGNQGS